MSLRDVWQQLADDDAAAVDFDESITAAFRMGDDLAPIALRFAGLPYDETTRIDDDESRRRDASAKPDLSGLVRPINDGEADDIRDGDRDW